ncbi:uncharacterized protein LOC132757097 [Ruditapes philippinarum]|uniref:uncharacterized protein LOC132757097 n=1 Tax=Ruditapes philippinarum TaxID=129788 RepID=UPI00295AA1C0|nr:uncharacterized protein LOC132757097 [Ruditapes philippinarum]
MERCGDGSVNSLGQDREGVQCQRNSIENDSVDTERVVLDPFDVSDIVTAATEISRTEESRKSTFWFEVIDFLQRMMLFKDFIMFARRLAHNTNEEFSKTIDVVIENSGEGNEGKYQILKRWREATPNAQLKDVIGAMKHYNLNALCADIIDKLNDKNLLDTDGDLLDTEISQNRNDHSLYPRNDLSVQDADTGIEENDLAQGGHLKMEDLKSFKCEDDDAWCIS